MTEMNEETADKIYQIKHKLSKYSEKKVNADKVNEYLEILGNVEINAEVLKETNICKFLKELKKKENPGFSQNAANLISKWKNDLVTKSNETNCKYEPIEINTVKSQNITPTSYNPTPKSSNKELKVKKKFSDDKSEKKTKEHEKRSKRRSDLVPQSIEKKAKLTLSDYKSLKGSTVKDEPNMFDSGNSINENEDSDLSEQQSDKNSVSGNNNNDLGFDSLSDDDMNTERYSPTPISNQINNKLSVSFNKVKSNESSSKKKMKSEQSSEDNFLFTEPSKAIKQKTKLEPYEPTSISNNNKNKKEIVTPPVPSISLQDLLSNNNSSKSEPYEPTSISKPLTSVYRSSSRPNPSFQISTREKEISKTSESVDEALSRIMKQKKAKFALYTGRKNNNNIQLSVPKLYDLCSRTLIDNLDTLPNKISIYNMSHDFAIAFELLKPVLERANAKQLENVENYSPHLLSDTDYIWKRISEQEFKKIEAPDDDESWRELYFKKLDAREEQFQRARNLVSKMQKSKPQERMTQMATMRPTTKRAVYLGPKSYNGPREGPAKSTSRPTSSSTPSYTKSAPKVIVHAERKPVSGFARAPPVMSQGMRATMKMLKNRRR